MNRDVDFLFHELLRGLEIAEETGRASLPSRGIAKEVVVYRTTRWGRFRRRKGRTELAVCSETQTVTSMPSEDLERTYLRWEFD
jgi:hypothetical protein